MFVERTKYTVEQPDCYLKETVEILGETLKYAEYISKLVSDRFAPPKQGWASVLFTRLCNMAITIYSLVPGNKYAIRKVENWDSSSIMALERNFIECFHTFYYLCVDDVPEEEWKCRKRLFDLHDCTERRRMFESFSDKDQVDKFLVIEASLKQDLGRNIFFQSLSLVEQNQILKGEKAFLLTNRQIQEKMGLDKNSFKGFYKLQSQHIHSLPMSFYRMLDEDRGRGRENNVDKGYIGQSTWMVSVYLTQATINMIELFEDVLVDDILNRVIPIQKVKRVGLRKIQNFSEARLPRILCGNAWVII